MTSELVKKLVALLELPAAVGELSQRVASLEEAVRFFRRADADELLDVEGAARLLSMTPAAVRKAAYRGTLPSMRLGRRVRFRRADLIAGSADPTPDQYPTKRRR